MHNNGQEIESNFFLGLTKNLHWFLDVKDVSLMSYCSCHFPSS
jgi:hypothetical protein